jgi:hypothetical protein
MTTWQTLHWIRCILPLAAPLVPLLHALVRRRGLGRLQRAVLGLALGTVLFQAASLLVYYAFHWENNYPVERALAVFQGLWGFQLLRPTLPFRLRTLAAGGLGLALGLAFSLWGFGISGLMDVGLSLLMAYRVVLALLVLLVLLRYRQWHLQASHLLLGAAATLLDAGVNLLAFTFFIWAAYRGGPIAMGIILLGSLASALSFLLLDQCLRVRDPLARWTGVS